MRDTIRVFATDSEGTERKNLASVANLHIEFEEELRDGFREENPVLPRYLSIIILPKHEICVKDWRFNGRIRKTNQNPILIPWELESLRRCEKHAPGETLPNEE